MAEYLLARIVGIINLLPMLSADDITPALIVNFISYCPPLGFNSVSYAVSSSASSMIRRASWNLAIEGIAGELKTTEAK